MGDFPEIERFVYKLLKRISEILGDKLNN